MIEIFRSWVLNIVTVIIFLIFIEIIIPSDKFKKYIKFVAGLVVMIVIINPIVAAINKNFTLDDLTLQAFNEFERSEIKRNYNDFEDYQNNQIIGIYKEKLKNQIKEKILSTDSVNNADININIDKDINSKQFGNLISINAKVYTAVDSEPTRIGNIQRVNINIDEHKENKHEKLVYEIKEKLSQIYEIPLENINISIH